MWFVKLFSTTDPKLGGNQGGSSQVFHIKLDADKTEFNKLIQSNSDLNDVRFRPVNQVLKEGLAYQQGDMLKMVI